MWYDRSIFGHYAVVLDKTNAINWKILDIEKIYKP